MKFGKPWIEGLLFALLTFASIVGAFAIGAESNSGYYWPTPNTAFVEGRGLASIMQPTASGKVESALFGCVRNNGHRFHEGVDLKPIRRDRRNEPTDPIYAFCNGVVRYVNRNAALSSYGRYVVIEHPEIAPGIVTLYAHLSSVPDDVQVGSTVVGGQTIATMGRSASYSIPRDRAHLHFEIGLWLGPDFQRWYDRQPFKTPNDHGSYNGLNIVGIDVWAFWKAYLEGEVASVMDFLQSEAIAVTVDVPYGQTPELVEIMPELLTSVRVPRDLAGWRIGFSWYGAPIQWTPLSASQLGSHRIEIREVDHAVLSSLRCNDMVRSGALPGPGPRLKSVLSRLFVNAGI